MSVDKKIAAIIEARMTSTRLPGKVLLPVCGKPLLAHQIERLMRVPSLDAIVVATTTNKTDDPVVGVAQRLGAGYFRGSEKDVLGRVLGAARATGTDIIVEITGDCPALDSNIVEKGINAFFATGADYVENIHYPGGMNFAVFTTETLAELELVTRNAPVAREHVSLPIYENPEKYKLHRIAAPPELSRPDIHIELDEPSAYEMIKAIFEALYPVNPEFDIADILEYLDTHPEIKELNAHVRRRVSP